MKPPATDEAPLGTFEEEVLLSVVRTCDEAYGMSVRREIETVTGRSVAVGAVYATLDRLEAKALVSSRRAVVEGVSRRLFSVTPAGAAALTRSRAIRERLWKGVDLSRVRTAEG
jgi:PadR family transcriptional regulator